LRVLGLPGNPASSLVCAHLFLEPLIARLAGRAGSGPQSNRAVLGKDLPENDQRQDYLRGDLARDPMPRASWSPPRSPQQDSSLMTVFADARCLVIRPPFAAAGQGWGSACEVLVLRD
jgi:molybdopterin molybdotransferase